MGADQSQPVGLGAHSTAKQVIDTFGEGKYLAGKVAVVTGYRVRHYTTLILLSIH